jgi:hypothetical protein
MYAELEARLLNAEQCGTVAVLQLGGRKMFLPSNN